ncbi:MAG: helix-turn-helix transcriptional regulator [Actinobacteria bacterium]|nr:helix-turn-helix transcriptional regulator [Actinomycetota bacterium]
MPEFHQAVYVISVAAELAGVHPQTLRIYERKGLLSPSRTGGGSRRYSAADIEDLRRIQQLTSEGINLAGVTRVLELERRIAQLERELHRTKQDAKAAVANAQRSNRRDLVPFPSAAVVLYDQTRRRR